MGKDRSFLDWLNGQFLAGIGGTIVAIVGLVNENTATLGVGAAIFAVATLGERVQRFEFPGSKIVMRRRPTSAEMGMVIDQLRDTEPAPAAIATSGAGWWSTARFLLGERIISSLLSRLEGPLWSCEARVFLPDAEAEVLMPAYRPDHAELDRSGWRFGEGVAGVAFRDNEYVYASGDALSAKTWGQTESLERRHEGLTAVAAAPLVDRVGSPIGVLVLSSRSPAPTLITESGRRAHLELAQQVSVCLIDLLRGGE